MVQRSGFEGIREMAKPPEEFAILPAAHPTTVKRPFQQADPVGFFALRRKKAQEFSAEYCANEKIGLSLHPPRGISSVG
ncbi:hypothetical protein [Alistipes sp.]|uniref:hypothetical protein n=1 Tax=Alistipes sp. TaxID=1872444 RepID=UPI003AF1BA7C